MARRKVQVIPAPPPIFDSVRAIRRLQNSIRSIYQRIRLINRDIDYLFRAPKPSKRRFKPLRLNYRRF